MQFSSFARDISLQRESLEKMLMMLIKNKNNVISVCNLIKSAIGKLRISWMNSSRTHGRSSRTSPKKFAICFGRGFPISMMLLSRLFPRHCVRCLRFLLPRWSAFTVFILQIVLTIYSLRDPSTARVWGNSLDSHSWTALI